MPPSTGWATCSPFSQGALLDRHARRHTIERGAWGVIGNRPNSQSGPPTLVRLLDRLTAVLDGVPEEPTSLPPAPTPEEASAMVARIAGSVESYSLLAGLDPEQYGGELRDEGGYLSAWDGPQGVPRRLGDRRAGAAGQHL
jgi:hypothetical protein